MKTESFLAVTFSKLDTTTEMAEIAKLAMKAAADLNVERVEDGNGRLVPRATMTRTRPGDLVQDIAWLVYADGMTRGKSPSAVLDDVRALLEKMHVPLDVPPSDGPGIAE
jgi:hypothetical protein